MQLPLKILFLPNTSLPTRERELKCPKFLTPVSVGSRSPHGSVNWNFSFIFYFSKIFVAPHTGAWIEILSVRQFQTAKIVAPHTGAWIEITIVWASDWSRLSRSPHGSVNWNYFFYLLFSKHFSRSPHGSVNWNGLWMFCWKNKTCRSPHGSVNWNEQYETIYWVFASRSPHGSVNWNNNAPVLVSFKLSSLPTRERELK